ncbi:ArsR family transcriptional regulator [Gulosibacter macacae]|uniref:ArsR family transcriptional regulator n=1 Tax=Gulosibacter macacae TaxID=2488791 RepID=A0A3P3VYE5_9MICO|nr:ArsR family transcriptional regulator [Gulosibacter macacae]RRJ86449.1 ArsR family transcriptional regulator [Gulosibacter macacae]
MNIERFEALSIRAARHAALSDVTRLQIVEMLTLSDRSSSELGEMLSIPSNLLAHHLKQLVDAGLVTKRRSEGDRRRVYFTLNDIHGLATGPLTREHIVAGRVVFVCSANTARSHLAAAAWRQHSSVPTISGGTAPGERINPAAIAAANRHGLAILDVSPRKLDVHAQAHDLIVTVCDRAHEELAGADWAHWSVPDPVTADSDRAFDAATIELVARVERLAEHVEAA